MNSAPWWGTALVAGLFGLAGVAVAQWVALRLDRSRTLREDERRWQSERRKAFAGFLAAAFKAYRITKSEWDADAAVQAKELLGEIVLAVEEINLLATNSVVVAAEELHSEVHNAVSEWHNSQRIPKIHKSSKARAKFVRMARQELGVTLSVDGGVVR